MLNVPVPRRTALDVSMLKNMRQVRDAYLQLHMTAYFVEIFVSVNISLVSVHIVLERSFDRQTHILGLLGCHLRQMGVHVLKVQLGDLLVEDFRQHVDTDVEFAGLAELDVFVAELFVTSLVQHDLCKDLIGEGT